MGAKIGAGDEAGVGTNGFANLGRTAALRIVTLTAPVPNRQPPENKYLQEVNLVEKLIDREPVPGCIAE